MYHEISKWYFHFAVLPRDGGWSSYGDWSACSAVCGGGTQTKTKTCTNPASQYGGLDCVGEDSETRDCNVYSCGGN